MARTSAASPAGRRRPAARRRGRRRESERAATGSLADGAGGGPRQTRSSVERVGAGRDELGGVGDATVGGDEADVELVGFAGGGDGFGDERGGLDDERVAVGQGERGTGGGGAEESVDGGGRERLFHRQTVGRETDLGGERGGEGGFGGDEGFEINGAQAGEVGEPFLRRGFPAFVGGVARFDVPRAEDGEAHADAREAGEMRGGFGGGFVGGGVGREGAEPACEFGFEGGGGDG